MTTTTRRLLGVGALLILATCRAGAQIPVPDPIGALIASGQARVTATRTDIGDPANVFDGKPDTLMRTPAINPAFVQIEFVQPYRVGNFYLQVLDLSTYRISCADSAADLAQKGPSYRDLTGLARTDPDGRALVRLAGTVTARVFRLDTQRLAGDDYVHVYAWEFCRLVPATSLRIEPVPSRPEWKPSTVFPSGGVLRLKAVASAPGAEMDVTRQASFGGRGFRTFRKGHPEELLAPRVGPTELRPMVVSAKFGRARAELPVSIKGWQVTNHDPDVDVLYIERTPRIDYDAPDQGNGPGWPATGQRVEWVAHVRSYGTRVRDLPYTWRLDGTVVATGRLGSIPADGEATATLPWAWDQRRHVLEFSVTPGTADACADNNVRRVYTDALAVGFWVEDMLGDYWHELQRQENPRNNSFEDWAQWMMDRWNDMMVNAKWPLSPNGLSDRWRLDHVITVPGGALPLSGGLPSNDPDMSDKTVDIMWGFNLDPGAQISPYWKLTPFTKTDYADHPPAFFIDWALLHEMSHARYLVDSYGFDVHPASIKIAAPDGKPAVDTPEMKAVIPHFNKYVGLMGGVLPPVYDEYTAGALERIRGRRARGGNYNSPSVIGEYLGDLPSRNTFTFLDPDGKPLAAGRLEAWQAKAVPTDWYGKRFEGEPSLRADLDSGGRTTLGRNPFGADPLQHTFGFADTDLLMRVTAADGRVFYHVQEVSDFNLEYWKGHRDEGFYTVRLKNRR